MPQSPPQQAWLSSEETTQKAMQTPKQKPELQMFAGLVSNLASFLSGMEQLFGKFWEPFGLSLLHQQGRESLLSDSLEEK